MVLATAMVSSKAGSILGEIQWSPVKYDGLQQLRWSPAYQVGSDGIGSIGAIGSDPGVGPERIEQWIRSEWTRVIWDPLSFWCPMSNSVKIGSHNHQWQEECVRDWIALAVGYRLPWMFGPLRTFMLSLAFQFISLTRLEATECIGGFIWASLRGESLLS